MPKKPNLETLFPNWQRQFADDAVADDCGEILRHIEYLELDCSRADMLIGTDMLLFAVLIYLQMDGKDCASLIKRQRYWLRGDGLSYYGLTFNFGKGHFGRILTDRNITGVDFADLFNHPWNEYKTAGFHEVYISRLDGKPIDKDELTTLYARFSEDMYYDYTADDVAVDVYMTEHKDTALASAVEHTL